MTPPKRPRQLDSRLVSTITRYVGRAHVWIYRRTGGRVGGKLRIGAGFRKPAPTLLLEHRGRKSGKLFVSPVLYITDGPNVIVVASAAGRREHPQWYRNLVTPTPTLRSVPIAVRSTRSPPIRRSGRGCGHDWWRPTPTSTTTRAGPTVKSQWSSFSRASRTSASRQPGFTRSTPTPNTVPRPGRRADATDKGGGL